MHKLSPGPVQTGEPVVDFTLPIPAGGRFDSLESRRKGALLIALFKTECPTCKFALPFVQRLYTLFSEPSGGRLQVVGISQDDTEATHAFVEQYGLTFPVLPDRALEATEAYRITHVPDLYLMGPEVTVWKAVLGGFHREGYNDLARVAAGAAGLDYSPLIRPEDRAPLLRPG